MLPPPRAGGRDPSQNTCGQDHPVCACEESRPRGVAHAPWIGFLFALTRRNVDIDSRPDFLVPKAFTGAADSVDGEETPATARSVSST